MQRGSQSHGCGVAAATAKCGDFFGRADALKAGNHRNFFVVDRRSDSIALNFKNFCLGVHRVGDDAHLRASEAHCLHTRIMQSHAQQRHADALTRGEQHVHFTAGRVGRYLMGQLHQVVSGFAHCRNHHHQVMPCCTSGSNMARHITHALGVGHRGSPVLLHDEGHDEATLSANDYLSR